MLAEVLSEALVLVAVSSEALVLVAVTSEVLVLVAVSSEAVALVAVSSEAVVLGDDFSSDPDPVVLVSVAESGEVVPSDVLESEEAVLV